LVVLDVDCSSWEFIEEALLFLSMYSLPFKETIFSLEKTRLPLKLSLAFL